MRTSTVNAADVLRVAEVMEEICAVVGATGATLLHSDIRRTDGTDQRSGCYFERTKHKHPLLILGIIAQE
jgi:hypothetical protein